MCFYEWRKVWNGLARTSKPDCQFSGCWILRAPGASQQNVRHFLVGKNIFFNFLKRWNYYNVFISLPEYNVTKTDLKIRGGGGVARILVIFTFWEDWMVFGCRNGPRWRDPECHKTIKAELTPFGLHFTTEKISKVNSCFSRANSDSWKMWPSACALMTEIVCSYLIKCQFIWHSIF